MATVDTTAAESGQPVSLASSPKGGIFNRFDNPLLNWKFLSGAGLLGLLILFVILGNILWDTNRALAATSPLNLPPYGFVNFRGQEGVPEHPLGTENSGRDMLALLIVGTPRTLMVGVLAAGVGMSVGILLGFTAGFVGGWVDDVIRVATDVTITIPALLVLIVIQSVIPRIELVTMALLISMFAWPAPTRLIRAQVLSMRESGYVKMAQLSGVPTYKIMFREMMPNLMPYLAASFIGNTAGAIITAIGLEVLGLGPQRIPSLGVTIYFSINAAAILRNMWWWWALPTVILAIIFIGLLLINLGLDEVANPRLRQARE
jgi:peptide/nickel transport system permease protein